MRSRKPKIKMKAEERENPTFETGKAWKCGQIKAKNTEEITDQRKSKKKRKSRGHKSKEI